MTGYGQGAAEVPGLRITVVLRCLNNRFADLRLRMPAELAAWESDLRRRCQAVVRRGRLEVSVARERTASGPGAAVVNRPWIASLVKEVRGLADEHGLGGDLDLRTVLSLPGAVLSPAADAPAPEPAERQVLERALDEALQALDRERLREGGTLVADLLQRVDLMLDLTRRVRERAAEVPALARDKLVKRVEALTDGVELDPTRLAQEAAFLADRGDVTEELVRLQGHLDQMRGLLVSPDGDPVGKRLDFLAQEVQRETNTISNKSADLELSRLALALKAEIERVREQAQNLE